MTPFSCHRAMPRAAALGALLLAAGAASAAQDELAELGRSLFHDTRLSLHRGQACATCHDPAVAFSDGRDNALGGAVSLGDDGRTPGLRNAPALTYASAVPAFGRDASGAWAGGLFHDGRAPTLEAQAREPLTNPLEMALPDAATVAGRVRENPGYVAAIDALFGTDTWARADDVVDAVTRALAAFERTAEFSTFDSRYDRALRGEIALSDREELGRKLFFSELLNCHSCHLLDPRELRDHESFTNYRFHNIGVPDNPRLEESGGTAGDSGLLQNPAVEGAEFAGKFRVPSLRNVAVTGPYMHNGVFRSLETVVLFYNRYTLTNPESQVNPETGRPWGDAAFADTVDLDLLARGQPISPLQVGALVAFMEALTDRRYEHLLGTDRHDPGRDSASGGR